MPFPPSDKKKLLPLRRFASDIYAPAYLSLLVQRGKLRAERIGRNYFTTREWFEEYLERHAREEKRKGYLYSLNASLSKTNISTGRNKNKGRIRENIFWSKTALIAAAVFLLLGIASAVFPRADDNHGIVAGAEERATTTEMMPR